MVSRMKWGWQRAAFAATDRDCAVGDTLARWRRCNGLAQQEVMKRLSPGD